MLLNSSLLVHCYFHIFIHESALQELKDPNEEFITVCPTCLQGALRRVFLIRSALMENSEILHRYAIFFFLPSFKKRS